MKSDHLIIGGGIMGLTIARALHAREPAASIVIIEKEDHVAEHASGRNSGVLHAGFYYSPDSLKAKFCREGNKAMRGYVATHGLRINDCGKVVVAQNESELAALHTLYERGKENGVSLEWVDEARLAAIEPNAKTYKQAIYSPTTAVVDPVEVCQSMRRELEAHGITIVTSTAYERRTGENSIVAGGREYTARKLINCAGGFAAKIAKEFGFCNDHAMLPFKGIYLEYTGQDRPIQRCVYGVPNPKNPFLGVHYSVTVHGKFKIGPTAIPVFGGENYHGLAGISLLGALRIAGHEAAMFATDSDFRGHALREIRKYSAGYMVEQAALMVKDGVLDKRKFTSWSRPGIRAQLVNIHTHKLLHDFVVEGDESSVHVLNAVSPAFTSSIPFAQWVVENYIGSLT